MIYVRLIMTLRRLIMNYDLLVLCEMQSVSFRIWTRVAVSISYDDNHYTTGHNYIIILFVL